VIVLLAPIGYFSLALVLEVTRWHAS